MKLISLTQGQFTQVDDWNYEWLMQWKWCALKLGKRYYAARSDIINGKQTTILMSRIIMNTPGELTCDHINHNPLNNQESNLRNCTSEENKKNRSSFGKSKYLGVSITKNGTYHAEIGFDRKKKELGTFKLEKDAAMAYNAAAKRYHGAFANLNIIE